MRSAARADQSVGHGRQLTDGSPRQRFDDDRERVEERVDVGVGRRPPDAGPQGAVGVDAHRGEHRRRLERLARARRARVHRDAALVEREQDRLGLDAVDAEAHEVGEAVGRVAEALDAGHARDALRAPVAPRALRSRRLVVARVERVRRGGAEADDGGDVLDAGPPRPLLRATDHERREAQTRAGRAARPRPSGPPNLWPVTEQRSAPSPPKSTATWPAAAQASTCTTTSRARACLRPPRPPVATCPPRGWRAARTPARCRAGWPPRPRRDRSDRAGRRRRSVTSVAPRATESRTDECSTAVVTTCAGAAPRQRAPHRGVDRLGAGRGEHDLARPGAEARRHLLARRPRPRPGWRVPRRAAGRDRRGARGGRGASPRARPVAAARTTRGRGRRAPRRRPSATRRQTRATQ